MKFETKPCWILNRDLRELFNDSGPYTTDFELVPCNRIILYLKNFSGILDKACKWPIEASLKAPQEEEEMVVALQDGQ